MKSEFNLQVTNNITLKGYIYEPATESKGVVQIVHGMAEHIDRYSEFMKFLCDNGYVVIGYDQRGHGKTAGSLENCGYMDDTDNIAVLVEDINAVNIYIKENYPNKLIYLFGHSMGSFLAQRYVELYNDTVDGLILSGSSYNKNLIIRLGHFMASIISKTKGRKHLSPLMNDLSFGNYNKKFYPNKTDFDWLSRDAQSNLKYAEDEYCGRIFSASFFKDFLKSFIVIAKHLELINNDLPIYIMSGDCDPVGNFGKGTTKLYKKLSKIGIKDVTLKLYKDGRHEMLNEINKQEVFENILEWINSH